MIKWWKERQRLKRQKQRERCAAELFPKIWETANGDPFHFICMVTIQLVDDPAWKCHDEWIDTPESPGRWAARQRWEDAQRRKS